MTDVNKGCECTVCTQAEVWAFVDEVKKWAGKPRAQRDEGPGPERQMLKQNVLRTGEGGMYFDLVEAWLRAWNASRQASGPPTRQDAAQLWAFMWRFTHQGVHTILSHIFAHRVFSAWPHLMITHQPIGRMDDVYQEFTARKAAHTFMRVYKILKPLIEAESESKESEEEESEAECEAEECVARECVADGRVARECVAQQCGGSGVWRPD